jgi:hypothetical protein
MLQPKKDTLVAHPLETCSRGQVREGMAEKQEPNIRYLLVVLVPLGMYRYRNYPCFEF